MSSETRTLIAWDGGSMEFDASVKESFTHEAEVTRYPIELDSDRVDHVRVQPTEITISAVVSNTPAREGLTHMDDVTPVRGYEIQTKEVALNLFGKQVPVTRSYAADVRLWSGTVRRVASVYAELLQMQREARALTILTAIGDFDEMVLKSLSISRDAATANALDFTATFQQLAVTSLALETLKPPDPKFLRSKKRKDKGLTALTARTVRFSEDGSVRVLESEGVDEQTRQQALNLGLEGMY